MKKTVTIDDELYERAVQLAGTNIKLRDLIEEALETYISVTAGRRLSALGGTVSEPSMRADSNAKEGNPQ